MEVVADPEKPTILTSPPPKSMIGTNALALGLEAEAALSLFIGADTHISKSSSHGEILPLVVRRIRRCARSARKTWTRGHPCVHLELWFYVEQP
jgi:hypothetical protein